MNEQEEMNCWAKEGGGNWKATWTDGDNQSLKILKNPRSSFLSFSKQISYFIY
jgi:hypothetical protein